MKSPVEIVSTDSPQNAEVRSERQMTAYRLSLGTGILMGFIAVASIIISTVGSSAW